jgi:hypothetical protein
MYFLFEVYVHLFERITSFMSIQNFEVWRKKLARDSEDNHFNYNLSNEEES